MVGSVVEGSVVFQLEGEQESVLRPGDVFFEPEGARIARTRPAPGLSRLIGHRGLWGRDLVGFGEWQQGHRPRLLVAR